MRPRTDRHRQPVNGARKGPVCLLVAMGVSACLTAGPPFRTDDPEPVALGHFEAYLFAAGAREPGHSSGLGPALEFNYGVLPDTQFHLVVPSAYDRLEGGPSRRGLGDLEVGVKVRLLEETPDLPQVGLFPLVELATAGAGLGAGHTQVYLPLWLQKAWGPWTTYGGVGWWRNPGRENRNWTYLGWLLQRDLGERLTLGAEAFHTTATTVSDRPASGINAGGQVNVTPRHHVLFSLGRNVSGGAQTFAYLGYQLTGEGFGDLRHWLGRDRP